MSIIKAPFNFIPVSNKVYFPEWADKISQDIPFEDGESGIIDLRIKAETPIFVRNGHTKEQADNKSDEYNSFSHINDKYYIPSTSIKGSIRNVLEIMSFGKLHLDNRAMFAQRDWYNEDLFILRDSKIQSQIHCGWLKVDERNYKIIDCGKPYQINHIRLDEYFGDNIFEKHFSEKYNKNLDEKFKLAGFKYKLTEDYNLSRITFSKDSEYNTEISNRRLRYDRNGDIIGTLVFTGQSSPWKMPRKKGAGKFYEFVFPDENKGEYKIDKGIYDHFKFIYQDSADWNIVRNKLDKEGIPVFFRVDDPIKKHQIKDFGLAFMYKLPYDHTPYDLLGDQHKENKKLDLAECVFGKSDKESSLKGRVQFSNAFAIQSQPGKKVSLVLGSPKASYYPFYISQEGKNGIVSTYNTYNRGTISGWKRYPVRIKTYEKSTGNEDIDTQIFPLNDGAEFIAKVRFHNLKKIEIGALLSALTFHRSEKCYHQIGQGKPYGFGKVSMQVHLEEKESQDEVVYMAMFEQALISEVGNWRCAPQITELFTMAHDEINTNDVQFDYMTMDNTKGINEFVKVKKEREFLQCYSALKGKAYRPESLFERYKDDVEAIREKEEPQSNLVDVFVPVVEQNLTVEDRLKAGLSFLEGVNLRQEYNVKDFKGAKSRIQEWLKKTGLQTIPEKEYSVLQNTLSRLSSNPTKKEKKSWIDFNSKDIWQPVCQWTNDIIAHKWFDLINK